MHQINYRMINWLIMLIYFIFYHFMFWYQNYQSHYHIIPRITIDCRRFFPSSSGCYKWIVQCNWSYWSTYSKSVIYNSVYATYMLYMCAQNIHNKQICTININCICDAHLHINQWLSVSRQSYNKYLNGF